MGRGSQLHIRHIQVVNLQPEDIIIYQVDRELSVNQKQFIVNQLKELIPNNKIIVTEANIKIIRRTNGTN